MAPTADNTETSEKVDNEILESPVVVELKKLDDKYLEIQRELEKELARLRQSCTEKQKPLLDQRAKLLVGAAEEKTGTPALKGFWLEALSNHPEIEDMIYEWDRPVLEYLRDIIVKPLDADNLFCGSRLTFHFSENPFFENAVLSVEYHTQEKSPYRGDDEKGAVVEMRGCDIRWKRGKDVTVEMVAPKIGKGKKAKVGKPKEESRESFFREVFRTMKAGAALPEDIDPHQFEMMHGSGDADMDESEMAEQYLELQGERGRAIRQVVSYAVRWYTGEAVPDDDSDDEVDDEETEEEDEESDENSDDNKDDKGTKVSADTAKKKSVKEAKKGGDESANAKKEECKQQ